MSTSYISQYCKRDCTLIIALVTYNLVLIVVISLLTSLLISQIIENLAKQEHL